MAPECSDWVPGQGGLLPGHATESLHQAETFGCDTDSGGSLRFSDTTSPHTLAEQASIPRGHTFYLHDTTILELMVPLRTNLEHDTTTSLLCGSSAVQTIDVQRRLGKLNAPHMAHAHSGPVAQG